MYKIQATKMHYRFILSLFYIITNLNQVHFPPVISIITKKIVSYKIIFLVYTSELITTALYIKDAIKVPSNINELIMIFIMVVNLIQSKL